MIDPGALGTLTIGLRHIQRQEATEARGGSSARRPRRLRRPIRHGIARILRRTAELVEPIPAAG